MQEHIIASKETHSEPGTNGTLGVMQSYESTILLCTQSNLLLHTSCINGSLVTFSSYVSVYLFYWM